MREKKAESLFFPGFIVFSTRFKICVFNNVHAVF